MIIFHLFNVPGILLTLLKYPEYFGFLYVNGSVCLLMCFWFPLNTGSILHCLNRNWEYYWYLEIFRVMATFFYSFIVPRMDFNKLVIFFYSAKVSGVFLLSWGEFVTLFMEPRILLTQLRYQNHSWLLQCAGSIFHYFNSQWFFIVSEGTVCILVNRLSSVCYHPGFIEVSPHRHRSGMGK